jgi:hypothetical protein
MQERRTEVRMLCADMVEVTWKNHTGKRSSVTGLLEDISPSGACLQLDEAVPLGVEIYWKSQENEFTGRVRYCVFRESDTSWVWNSRPARDGRNGAFVRSTCSICKNSWSEYPGADQGSLSLFFVVRATQDGDQPHPHHQPCTGLRGNDILGAPSLAAMVTASASARSRSMGGRQRVGHQHKHQKQKAS